jgi:hypothetical protein
MGLFTRQRWSSTTFSLYFALLGSNTFILHDFAAYFYSSQYTVKNFSVVLSIRKSINQRGDAPNCQAYGKLTFFRQLRFLVLRQLANF